MTDERPTRQHTMVGIWTAIGIGIGTSLGVAMNSLGIWVLLGLVIGLGIGIALDRRSQEGA